MVCRQQLGIGEGSIKVPDPFNQEQILDINKNLRSEGGKRMPGYGGQIGMPSVAQKVSNTWNNTVNSAEQATSRIIDKIFK